MLVIFVGNALFLTLNTNEENYDLLFKSIIITDFSTCLFFLIVNPYWMNSGYKKYSDLQYKLEYDKKLEEMKE